MIRHLLPGALATADPLTLWALGFFAAACVLLLGGFIAWARENDRRLEERRRARDAAKFRAHLADWATEHNTQETTW